MANGVKEFELKLRIDPADGAVIRNHPTFSDAFQDAVRERLVSVYFDSDDRFLRDHGLTLRVRHAGDRRIQTIKTLSPDLGTFERTEWERPINRDVPDLTGIGETELGHLLDDDICDALKPIFETRVERTTYHLNSGGSDIIVAFDDGEIVGTRSSCPISEIELELKRGDPGQLFRVARSIGEIVPAWVDVKSKSERGYDLLENKAIGAEKASEFELPAGLVAGRAFKLIGRTCLRQLLVNEPATKQRNSEALHQMRIGLRRLRAAMSLFSEVVDDARVETIKAELKWLGMVLAPARDLDSFLSEALRPLRKRQADEPGLESIGRMFARERLNSYRRARDALESARFRRLVLDTAEWIEAGPWSVSTDPLSSARRSASVEALAADQLSRRRKKIRKRGAEIGALDPEELHKLRIQIKKTRYAVEFFSSVFQGKKATKRRRKFRDSLKELQTCLGGFNDIVTREALCTKVLERPGRSLTEEQRRRRVFAAGLITGDQQAQLGELLARARKAYARFDDAKPFW